MAILRMTMLDLLNKDEQGADPSFLRDGVRLLAPELMELPEHWTLLQREHSPLPRHRRSPQRLR